MTRKDTLNDTNFVFSHSLLRIFDKGRQLPITVKLENFFFHLVAHSSLPIFVKPISSKKHHDHAI